VTPEGLRNKSASSAYLARLGLSKGGVAWYGDVRPREIMHPSWNL